ncbi:MAG: hypothetical protein QXF14_00620 [Candidatus Woesearchaeota archaeon]
MPSAGDITLRRTTNTTQQYASESLARLAATNRTRFTGLTGIFGVSIQPVEQFPQRPFGKTMIESQAVSRLPAGWVGPGGIANATPGVSRFPCADFGCKAAQYIVGDTSTMKYYRCWCDSAKKIAMENIKCLDTPAIASRLGYSEGIC